MKKIFLTISLMLYILTACTFSTQNIITHFNKNGIGSYPVPEPGEIVVTEDVREAMEHYKNSNVKYLLYFTFYDKDGEVGSKNTEERLFEYQRLCSLGYRLYKGKPWTYKNKGERYFYDAYFLLLTKEEIKNFKINEKYGYTFTFIHNGDYSPIDFKNCKIISLQDLNPDLPENIISLNIEKYYKKYEPHNLGRLYIKLIKEVDGEYFVLTNKYSGDGHLFSDLFVLDKKYTPLYKTGIADPMSSCFSVAGFFYNGKTILFGAFNDTKWIPEKDTKIPVEIDNVYVKLKSGAELKEKIDYKSGCILILYTESEVEKFEIYNKLNKLQASSNEMYQIEIIEPVKIN